MEETSDRALMALTDPPRPGAMREQYEFYTKRDGKTPLRTIQHRCSNCLVSVGGQQLYCGGCGAHFEGTVKV